MWIDNSPLNPQTVRNHIDQGLLPAVRFGRRVRVRRADLDRILAQGSTPTGEPQPATGAPTEAVEELVQAHQRAQRWLGRRSAARRGELAQGLQELTDATATALKLLSDDAHERKERHP